MYADSASSNVTVTTSWPDGSTATGDYTVPYWGTRTSVSAPLWAHRLVEHRIGRTLLRLLRFSYTRIS